MPQATPRSVLCALTVLVGALALPSQAQTVKVGLAMDLSGPFAVGGAEAKAGFAVAMKQLGGKLGGVPVEFVEADTAGNPEMARQVVERMLLRDKIDLFTGPVGSSVALAVGPPLFAAKVPYLSSNTGPSRLATDSSCARSTSWPRPVRRRSNTAASTASAPMWPLARSEYE